MLIILNVNPESPVFRFFEKVGFVIGKVIKYASMVMIAGILRKGIGNLLPPAKDDGLPRRDCPDYSPQEFGEPPK